jgi:energy-coupling factor transporter ATP-binding protein EcfA2
LLALAGLIGTDGQITVNAPEKADQPFGLVFQNADDQLFCPTIGEDIAFGPRNQKQSEKEVTSRVHKALAATGLAGFEKRSTHHLSGGEKKRAAIAAALACAPSILALDEPWANLDARGAHAVSSILRAFTGTLIIASHDLPRAAALCERMMILDSGILASDAPTEEILCDKELLERHGLEV